MVRIAGLEAEGGAPLAPRLDWRRVEEWTFALAAGDARALEETFAAKAAPAPEAAWDPAIDRLAAPQQRFLLRYWRDLAGARRMPLARDIDALEMRPALGYVNLLDVIAGGENFRYRVFGSAIATVCGYDMTGQTLSALKTNAHVVEFLLAAYRAVLRRRAPLMTVQRPPAAVQTVTWHALALPLADEAGAVTRLLVGNVPLARDGRPVALRL